MDIADIATFHHKMGLPLGDKDRLLGDKKIQEFRTKFLDEELNEFKEALAEGDRVKAFDALLDLVYVAGGTALFMGVTPAKWNAGWSAVQQANMAKERVANAKSSKRESDFDVVKPKGWVGPEEKLEEIMQWTI